MLTLFTIYPLPLALLLSTTLTALFHSFSVYPSLSIPASSLNFPETDPSPGPQVFRQSLFHHPWQFSLVYFVPPTHLPDFSTFTLSSQHDFANRYFAGLAEAIPLHPNDNNYLQRSVSHRNTPSFDNARVRPDMAPEEKGREQLREGGIPWRMSKRFCELNRDVDAQ